jgi:hypothetical protein
MRSTGVQLSAPRHVLGYGRGFRFDVVSYFDRCRALVADRGGWALTGANTDHLRVDRRGRVTGAVVRSDGRDIEIDAGTVILATEDSRAMPSCVAGTSGPTPIVFWCARIPTAPATA